MNPRSSNHRLLQPGINLTPMLDIIFNLLFFFILTTTIRTEKLQMDISLPGSSQAASAPASDQGTIITLDAQGQIALDGQIMVEDELTLKLYSLVNEGMHKVTIHGDEHVDYGRVVRLWDLCKSAGIRDVFMDLKPLARPGSESE